MTPPTRYKERRYCPTCKFIFRFRPDQAGDFLYCGRDGTRLEDAPKCISCGWFFFNLSSFCPQCGTMREGYLVPSSLQDRIANSIHSMTITDALRLKVCIDCKKNVEGSFRDDLSVKEYGISGLCQECQDKVFKG